MIKFLKVELDDHCPRFIISVKEIPILEAFDVGADQHEWALKISVSMPDFPIISTIHLKTVEDVIGLWD